MCGCEMQFHWNAMIDQWLMIDQGRNVMRHMSICLKWAWNPRILTRSLVVVVSIQGEVFGKSVTKTSELYAYAYKRRNSSFRSKDKSRKCFDFSTTTIFVQSWADSLVGCRLWAHQWESGLLECSFSVVGLQFRTSCSRIIVDLLNKWIASFHWKNHSQPQKSNSRQKKQ